MILSIAWIIFYLFILHRILYMLKFIFQIVYVGVVL
jgi:hypothetical protein